MAKISHGAARIVEQDKGLHIAWNAVMYGTECRGTRGLTVSPPTGIGYCLLPSPFSVGWPEPWSLPSPT